VEFTEEQIISQEMNLANPSAAGSPGSKEDHVYNTDVGIRMFN